MKRFFSAALWMTIAMLISLSTSAADVVKTPTSTAPARELIYCADLMTHEERESYRASMRAARTPQKRAELRQAHQKDMRERARERGMDAMECEPQRLRQRGGRP